MFKKHKQPGNWYSGGILLRVWLAGLILLASAWSSHAENSRDETSWWQAVPTIEDAYPVQGLTFPERLLERTLLDSETAARIVAGPGVAGLESGADGVSFTLAEDTGELMIGNVDDNQPLAERTHLFPLRNILNLRVRQSGGNTSTWNRVFYADGKPVGGGLRNAVTVTGDGAVDIVLDESRVQTIVPDGIKLTIKAEKGARFVVENIRVTQEPRDGYARKEIVLPDGEIWKAMADVCGAGERTWWMNYHFINDFYINGKLVKRPLQQLPYQASAVDIRPYLRPGRNVFGFRCWNPSFRATALMQASIVMESGEIIQVATDDSWVYSPDAGDGWAEPGYDSSAWEPITAEESILDRHKQAVPAHHGVLEIRNPARRDLVYNDAMPINVTAFVPAGMAARAKTVEWVLALSDADGNTTMIDGGMMTASSRNGESLSWPLDLGTRPAGTYTLSARLMDADGQIIDRRSPEPLLVIRRFDSATVTDSDYTAGLELELEREIDFTDTADPHPWVEGPIRRTEPVIVEQDGLLYREVGSKGAGAYFSYRFGEFEHPGDFYLFELEYPDNDDRCLELSISLISDEARNPYVTENGVGVETGGKFYRTGRMRTLRWLHIADDGVHAIDIRNLWTGLQPSAARRLRVYHVNNELPSAGAGSDRLFGIHTERTWPENGVFRVFGANLPYPENKNEASPLGPPLTTALITLDWYRRAAENYAQYLRFSGQNMHLMGCIQYNHNNTGYVPAARLETEHVNLPLAVEPRVILANVLDANNIKIFGGIEFSALIRTRTYFNDGQLALGADSIYKVDAKGLQNRGSYGAQVWQDPRFIREYIDAHADVAYTFAHLTNFMGVTTTFSPRSIYYPNTATPDNYDNPLYYDYDDVTWQLFEEAARRATGIAPDDPERFAQRAELLAEDEQWRDEYLEWRRQRWTELTARTAEAVSNQRSDLNLLSMLGTEFGSPSSYLLESGRDLKEVMFDAGVDLDALAVIPNHSVLRWTVSWASVRWTQNPVAWFMKESPMVASAFDAQPRRALMARSSWHESNYTAPDMPVGRREGRRVLVEDTDWLMNWSVHRTHPQPSGESAREALIQGLILSDPEWVFTGFTDAVLNTGHEDVWRDVMRIVTHLPRERFESVLETDLTTGLALRVLRQDGQTWFYVANPGYWRAHGTLRLRSGAPVLSVPAGNEVAGRGAVTLEVDLEPFGLAAFRAATDDLTIEGYELEPITARELSHMTDILDRIEVLVNDRVAGGMMLPPEERPFMLEFVQTVRVELEQGEYARAWSMIKKHRFWNNWKDYLEKGAATINSVLQSRREDFDPAEVRRMYRVNCGSDELYKDTAGNVWLPDIPYLPGISAYGHYPPTNPGRTSNRGNIDIQNTANPVIYRTERWQNPEYMFIVEPGNYTLRLHFAETFRFRPGNFKHDVVIQGDTVLKDWDMNTAAGEFRHALVKEFKGVQASDGELHVAFPEGKIMGIEVLPENES